MKDFVQQHAASGAFDKKGDFSSQLIMFDTKSSQGSSIRLGLPELQKVCRQAREQDREPAIVLALDHNCPQVPEDWVCIPIDLFRQFMVLLAELGGIE